MPKQNKFTKSVMERIEQEAARPKAKKALPVLELPEPVTELETEQKPESLKEHPTVAATLASPIPIDEHTAPGRNQTETPRQIAGQGDVQTAVPDLSAFITQHQQRQAKNKTFYLDKEVADAVRRTAKAQRTTESRLVNDILGKVLGV